MRHIQYQWSIYKKFQCSGQTKDQREIFISLIQLPLPPVSLTQPETTGLMQVVDLTGLMQVCFQVASSLRKTALTQLDI